MKGTVKPKVATKNEVELDYDTTISSDENSDCCSEPATTFEDRSFARKIGWNGIYKQVCGSDTNPSYGANEANTVITKTKFSDNHPSSSLRDICDIKFEVV